MPGITKKILVIEDSEELRDDITEMLSLEGFSILTAPNGKEGVDLAEKEHPQLIICDIRMPIMDGYDVLEYIRSHPTTMNIPFIFLTARTGRSEWREGMALGADDYLTKPFTAEELITSVNTRLDRRRSVVEEAEERLDQLRKSIALALPHEMRTPLNAILGFSEILMTDAAILDQQQVEEMAQHINDASNRLYRLVENYVIYANLEIMKTDEKRRRLVRTGRAEYAGAIITQQAQHKAINYKRENDLHLDTPHIDGTLAIDADNLARIVMEVIDNAFKFSRQGDAVHVSATVKENMLHIRVTDNGWGMTQEDIDAIGAYMQFERAFFEQQGLGFGLTIANRMTEVHEGTFHIESIPGKTTTVHIHLPFVTEPTTA